MGLTAANVDVRAGELRISDSKSGEGRVIPLRDQDGRLNAVGELVERRMAQRVIGDRVVPWLFHHKGKPIADFRKAWVRACKAAGLTGPVLDAEGRPVLDAEGEPRWKPARIFHDFRRSFARDAVDAGNDYKTVMDIGGWKTVSTFHRYKIVDTKRMASALARTHTFREAQGSTPTVISLAEARSR